MENILAMAARVENRMKLSGMNNTCNKHIYLLLCGVMFGMLSAKSIMLLRDAYLYKYFAGSVREKSTIKGNVNVYFENQYSPRSHLKFVVMSKLEMSHPLFLGGCQEILFRSEGRSNVVSPLHYKLLPGKHVVTAYELSTGTKNEFSISIDEGVIYGLRIRFVSNACPSHSTYSGFSFEQYIEAPGYPEDCE